MKRAKMKGISFKFNLCFSLTQMCVREVVLSNGKMAIQLNSSSSSVYFFFHIEMNTNAENKSGVRKLCFLLTLLWFRLCCFMCHIEWKQ